MNTAEKKLKLEIFKYLRLRIISKGGYIENGKVVHETTAGKRNVINRIRWMMNFMYDFISLNKLYTEEETLNMIRSAFYRIGYDISIYPYPDGTTSSVEGIEEWFNENKKK